MLSDKIFRWKLNEEFPCKVLRQNGVGQKAVISGHEIVHRTLLPDYALYIITIFPSNVSCKRTYDNFVELRDVLHKMYPGVKVPSLSSGSWFSESDITLINKNKIILEIFLNDIIDHPILSRTDLVSEFLSAKEQRTI